MLELCLSEVFNLIDFMSFGGSASDVTCFPWIEFQGSWEVEARFLVQRFVFVQLIKQ